MISTKNNQSEDFLSVDKLDQRKIEERGEPAEQLISIPLKEEDPEKTVQIGSQLSDLERQQLVNLLAANVNSFAWLATDISEILSKVITHRLNIDPKVRLVRQKKRSFAPERQKIIDEKIDKLLADGFRSEERRVGKE